MCRGSRGGGLNKAIIAATRIVAPYLVLGILWIFVSDTALLLAVGGDVDRLGRLQTAKGWFFVTITTLMLFALSYSHLRQIQRLRELDAQTGLLHRKLFLEYLELWHATSPKRSAPLLRFDCKAGSMHSPYN